MHAKRALIAACLLALSLAAGSAGAQEGLPKTSVTTDASDLWWNPSESGWGMQLVQEDDFVFATLFIYGADGKPTWVSGQLSYLGNFVFSGPLYVTSGPYFGAPSFNPSTVGIRQAGTMTFTMLTVSTGRVQYTVDGVAVDKQVQRQTLKADNYNGSYFVAGNITQSSCFNSSLNGNYNGVLGVSVSHTSTSMSMTWQFTGGYSCSYTGSYTQLGKFGRFSGPYACTTGEVGTMTFFEMTNRIGMISGRLTGSSSNAGCAYTGRFTGLDPSVP